MMCEYSRIAVALACLMLQPIYGFGQSPATQRLKVIPLEGHNAINYLPNRSTTTPVDEVRDENGRPVEGASVVFRLPSSGPGAVFATGQTSYTTITDFRGQAEATGYATNGKPGRFVVEITATLLDRTGRFQMTQMNSTESVPAEISGLPRSSSMKKWLLLGTAAGVGAGLGIYFAVRGSSPIGVSTGPVSFGVR